MNKAILATLALLLAAPAVAADNWEDDTPTTAHVGDSGCRVSQIANDPGCTTAYACTGGSPPQVVDFALYCSGRLVAEAVPLSATVPYYAWSTADSLALSTRTNVLAVTAMAQPAADEFNTVGCGTIWSFFCANPVVLPSEMPVNDPVNGYPDALPGPY